MADAPVKKEHHFGVLFVGGLIVIILVFFYVKKSSAEKTAATASASQTNTQAAAQNAQQQEWSDDALSSLITDTESGNAASQYPGSYGSMGTGEPIGGAGASMPTQVGTGTSGALSLQSVPTKPGSTET